MTPNFSCPACTHPRPMAAIALRPSGASQTCQSPPQPPGPRRGGRLSALSAVGEIHDCWPSQSGLSGFPEQGVGSNRPVKPKPRLRLALGFSGEQSGQLLWGHLEVASPLVANPVSSPAWTSPQSLSGSGGRTRIALAGTLAAAELSRQSRSGNGPRLRPRHSQDGP